MESFQALVDWLADNESAFSAIAAILVISGIVYGALRFILAPLLGRRGEAQQTLREMVPTRRADGEIIEDAEPAPQNKSLHDEHESLAVLLFEALSDNKDDEFLASGITSEVIAHVTMVPNIRVSSKLSSFAFKSGTADIQSVAEQLSTRFILTGSLRRFGERIMVIAQLTDADSNTEVWAQTYDREIEDLFAVQHDIAKCITGAVLGEVKMAEILFANETPVHQLDAWGLAQKAYHFWLTSFTPEGILKACDYLRQALEIDPEYASARAALAMLLAQQMTVRIAPDYEASMAEARELIETAYRQAPNDINVLENAGVVWQNIGEKERALLALRRVVQLVPLNLIARGYLALLLGLTGGEKGAREAKELIADNFATAAKHPSAPYWNFFLSVAEQALGEHGEAIERAQSSLIGQPGWVHSLFVIANSSCALGDRAAAEQAIQQAQAINPYLTAQLYAENIYLITGSKEQSVAFVGGLKEYEFVV